MRFRRSKLQVTGGKGNDTLGKLTTPSLPRFLYSTCKKRCPRRERCFPMHFLSWVTYLHLLWPLVMASGHNHHGLPLPRPGMLVINHSCYVLQPQPMRVYHRERVTTVCSLDAQRLGVSGGDGDGSTLGDLSDDPSVRPGPLTSADSLGETLGPARRHT